MWRRIFSVLMAAFFLFLVPGCYERVTRGEESVYGFAWWLGVAVIAGGLLFVPGGWLLRKASPKWGFVMMVLAPVLLVIVAPAMYSDRVVITPEYFEAKYGFWFSPSVHYLRFDDLNQINYVEVRDNRNRVSYELHCISKTKGPVTVHAGNLVINAVPEILGRAKAKGVQILGHGP